MCRQSFGSIFRSFLAALSKCLAVGFAFAPLSGAMAQIPSGIEDSPAQRKAASDFQEQYRKMLEQADPMVRGAIEKGRERETRKNQQAAAAASAADLTRIRADNLAKGITPEFDALPALTRAAINYEIANRFAICTRSGTSSNCRIGERAELLGMKEADYRAMMDAKRLSVRETQIAEITKQHPENPRLWDAPSSRRSAPGILKQGIVTSYGEGDALLLSHQYEKRRDRETWEYMISIPLHPVYVDKWKKRNQEMAAQSTEQGLRWKVEAQQRDAGLERERKSKGPPEYPKIEIDPYESEASPTEDTRKRVREWELFERSDCSYVKGLYRVSKSLPSALCPVE